MQPYHDLLRHILEHGVRKPNRTGTDTIAVFGHQLRFDLRDGFPLVTTKKIHTKSVLYELFWMLNGDSNVKFLQDHGVTIWDEWAKEDYLPHLGHEEGELGPVYGAQWRNWHGATTIQMKGRILRPGDTFEIGNDIAFVTRTIDQIEEIVEKLIHKPEDRRNILSAWNVAEIPRMKLPPCHILAQFDVTEGRLSCHMTIRSWDVFLGGPFNIAQYAFLTHILAHTTQSTKNPLTVGDLIISSGDTHLYVNHLDQVHEQISREPRPLPRLEIAARGQDARSREHGCVATGAHEPFQYEDFRIHGYDPYPAIKAEVAV